MGLHRRTGFRVVSHSILVPIPSTHACIFLKNNRKIIIFTLSAVVYSNEVTFERGPIAFVVVRFDGETMHLLKRTLQGAPALVGANVELQLSSGAATAEMKAAVALIAWPALLLHTDFADVSESLVDVFNKRFGPFWGCVIGRTVEG